MSGIKCLIVEDNARAAQIVAKTITSNFDEIEIVGIAEKLREARDKIAEFDPELLILDVNLPDGSAFELLKSLSSIDFNIIFTTAYSKYAIEAFKFSALDFLLKPHSPEELIIAVKKAIENFDQNNYQLQLEAFYHNFSTPDNQLRKLILRNADAIHLVNIDQIICAQSDNNYTIFHIEDDRQIMVSKPLKSFEQKLVNYGFFRVHQSHLINLQHVVAFNKREETISLIKGINVPVAQSKRVQLLNYFDSLA